MALPTDPKQLRRVLHHLLRNAMVRLVTVYLFNHLSVCSAAHCSALGRMQATVPKPKLSSDLCKYV